MGAEAAARQLHRTHRRLLSAGGRRGRGRGRDDLLVHDAVLERRRGEVGADGTRSEDVRREDGDPERADAPRDGDARGAREQEPHGRERHRGPVVVADDAAGDPDAEQEHGGDGGDHRQGGDGTGAG